MQKENQLRSCCKNNLSSLNTRPSSPRSVSMRGIGAAHTLYPALQTCGMTERVCRVARMANHGFTLIELLVVVLIIGILAAVAVPQYQKAVEKSKVAQALALLRSMYQAGQAHLLASGQWPSSVEELDIEIPAELSEWHVDFMADTLTNRGYNNWITMIRKSGPYTGAGFIIFQDRDTLYKNSIEMERILCIERFMGTQSLRFTKNQGDYCQKIMQGTLLSAEDGNSTFKVPY